MTSPTVLRTRRWTLLLVVGVALGLLAAFALQQAVHFYNKNWYFAQAVANKKWRHRYWSLDAEIRIITDNGVSPRAQQSLVKVSNKRGIVAFKMFRFDYLHSYGSNEDAMEYYFAAELALLAKDDLAGLLKLGYVTDITQLDLKIPSTSAVPVEQGPPTSP